MAVYTVRMTTTATANKNKSNKSKAQVNTKANGAKSPGKGKQKRNWRTAATADRHELYELSVQDTEAECDFIDEVWEERRGRTATEIREDFCGTGQTSMTWVKRRKDNIATGVDLDGEVLEWGRNRAAQTLTSQQQGRLTLKQADVTTVEPHSVDSVLAMNFSYYIFRTRKMMRKYFKQVRQALKADGLFILDAYGGSEAFAEIEEERDLDGFTYVWDQHRYNPINGEAVNYIHFRFPDGTAMERAFTYVWRLWTLPEIRELLEEAGFQNITIYWEGTDEESGEGDGNFTPTTEGEACEGWIAYIVAEP